MVRDEMRFLDGLSNSPATLPCELENERLGGGEIGIDKIAEAVVSLPIKHWKTSLFSSNYLTVCNPISFRPIGMSLLKSKALRKAVRSAFSLAKGSISIKDLEPAGREALVSGIEDSSLQCDADSNFTPFGAGVRAKSAILIEMSVKDSAMEFTVKDKYSTLWQTWIRGVDFLPKAWQEE